MKKIKSKNNYSINVNGARPITVAPLITIDTT